MPEINLDGAEKAMILRLSTAHLSAAAVAYLNKPPTPQPSNHTAFVVNGLFEDVSLGPDSRRHRWLSLGGDSLVVYPTEYGWFVYAHDALCGGDADQVPDELWQIMKAAADRGFAWIEFDRDVPACPGIPVYEDGR